MAAKKVTATLGLALDETDGPLTDAERAWADSVLDNGVPKDDVLDDTDAA